MRPFLGASALPGQAKLVLGRSCPIGCNLIAVAGETGSPYFILGEATPEPHSALQAYCSAFDTDIEAICPTRLLSSSLIPTFCAVLPARCMPMRCMPMKHMPLRPMSTALSLL